MELSYRNTDYEWISDKNTLETVIAKITRKINNSINPVILGDTLIKKI